MGPFQGDPSHLSVLEIVQKQSGRAQTVGFSSLQEEIAADGDGI